MRHPDAQPRLRNVHSRDALSGDRRVGAALRVAAGATAAALLLACGGGGGSTGPSGGSNGGMMNGGTGGAGDVVVVSNNKFTPATLTVPGGTTVTWQWSSGGVVHNVTFDDGATSGNMSAGSYPRTFATAGTYRYHCTIHGAAMSGSVVVQ
jgi:plastocyanin